MPGMMKKGMMYQEGGPVRSPGKRRIMEGGPKGLPMMTPEQLRQAREAMTPEERREYQSAPDAREMEDRQRRMKKGGMVKKAAGGMVKAKAPVKKKAGGVVKKAMGGMVGKGCK
jgi:hypothetical protein